MYDKKLPTSDLVTLKVGESGGTTRASCRIRDVKALWQLIGTFLQHVMDKMPHPID